MRLYISFILSRIYNSAFRNRKNEFFYLFILSAILVKIMSFINDETLQLSIFLIIFSVILSITTIRGSNNVIYSMITKHISMNLLDKHLYHSLDYYTEREEVAELFKEEFITGLENLSKKPFCKKIKMTTHRWVFDNIVNTERIKKIYTIKYKSNTTCKIPQEVLLLCSYKSIKDNIERLNKSAFQDRDKYEIILIRKNVKEL